LKASGYRLLDDLVRLIDQTKVFGLWGPVLLGALTFLGALFFVPRTPTSIAAGLAFGMWSAPIVLLGATVGAVVMFWAVRSLGLEDRVQNLIVKRPRLALLVRAIDKDHWRLLALLRFWGPVPASVQNCMFALTSIRMSHFAAVSLVFGAPQAFAYAYLGSLGHGVVTGELSPTAAAVSALFALACIATAGALIGIRIRAELSGAQLSREA
jgi:uncharacterized membrane protein YdjX (TVP38/TMEM64 family)